MANQNAESIAKRIYITYKQLGGLLHLLEKRLIARSKNVRPESRVHSGIYAKQFNAILREVKETFKIDKDFLGSINDLEEVEEVTGPSVNEKVLVQGKKLEGAIEAFISLYMGSKEKEKIGFSPN